MLILSQDKTRITNLDNVNTIFASKGGNILSFDNTYKSEDDCSDVLGKYSTEERAKEVLQEIMKAYKSQTQVMYNPKNGMTKNINMKVVYEMPEK